MNLISLDLEGIKKISALSVNINDEMTNNVLVLKPVVEHNDWNCKERDILNEMINMMKKDQDRLAQISIEISKKMLEIASKAESIDESLPSRFSFLDTLLGTAGSLTNSLPGLSVEPTDKNMMPRESVASFFVDSAIGNYATANANQTINICNFSDFVV